MVEITQLYECFFVRRYKTIRQHALLQNLVKWAFGTLQNRPLQLSLAVDLNDINVLTAISLDHLGKTIRKRSNAGLINVISASSYYVGAFTDERSFHYLLMTVELL